MNFEIVLAKSEHLDHVVNLFNDYRVYYEQEPNLKKARNFIKARLSREDSVIFLALSIESDMSMALGFTQLYPSFSSVSTKRLWILNDLFVSDEARRFGVARALMEKARTFAIETGSKGLILETAMDNGPAQALYESLGYTRDDEYYRYFLNV